MRPRLLGRTGLLLTGLRFAVVAPVALVVAFLIMRAPVRDVPGIGGDNLACAVMMEVDAPVNQWLFAALFAASLALASYGADRLLARWIGVEDRRASVALAAVLFVAVGVPLAVAEFGIFC